MKKILSFKYFLIAFIPAIIILGVIGYFGDQESKRKNLEKFIANQRIVLDLKKQILSDYLSPAISNLYFLSNLPVVKEFSDISKRPSIEKEMKLFSQSSKFFQIRVLDMKGHEAIRVDFTDDGPTIIPSNDLQDKSQRDYFIEGAKLNKSEIYISPINLNIESGKIQQPFRSMMRILTPIYSDENQKIGLLCINYELNDLFNEKLNWEVTDKSQSDLLFTNSKGYALNQNETLPEYGFMFDSLKNASLENNFPNHWKEINDINNGSIFIDNELFVFLTLEYSNLISKINSENRLNYSIPSENKIYLMFYSNKEKLSVIMTAHRCYYFIAVTILILTIFSFILSYQKFQQVKRQKRLIDSYREIKKNENLLSIRNSQLESFVRVASHDLREPLASIQSISGSLAEMSIQEDSVEYKYLKYIKLIKDSSDRMNKLITEILNYAMTGKKSDAEIVDFKEIIKILELDLSGLIGRTDAKIIYDELPIMYAYPVEIRQLLQNIISNSLKYRNADLSPIIQINYKMESDFHLFEIIDNGIGISEKDQDRVFNMFERLDSSSSEEGFGIGLSISKKIVELHSGDIWVKNNPSGGTIFGFSLKDQFPFNNEKSA